MTRRERYYWDLVGHLVVPGVLNSDEVAAANEALDHADDRMANGKDAYAAFLRETANAAWLDGHFVRTRPQAPFLLMLESPHCEPFRKMLVHPEIVGRLHDMCGAGFRLDSGPVFIGGVIGTPIHMLHGAGEPHKPYVSYDSPNGTFFAGGVTVAYLLGDAGPDDGGFACVPGSHKSRFPIPPGVRTMEDDLGCVEKPAGQSGRRSVLHGWCADPRRPTLEGLTPAADGSLQVCLPHRCPPRIRDRVHRARAAVGCRDPRGHDAGTACRHVWSFLLAPIRRTLPRSRRRRGCSARS